MPVSFEFATAGRVVVGSGTFSDVGVAARTLGRHAFVVTGRSRRHADALAARLAVAGVELTVFTVDGEPAIDAVTAGVRAAIDAGADLVIGLGGGSALDTAKAVAALAANPGDPFDYLEVVGRGLPLPHAAWPVIAIPTTAGTGSEVTRNAVIAILDRRVKVSLRSVSMLPRVAVVDPDLTLDLPAMLTATTGLDALTQLIEPYVSSRANPMVDTLCAEGMRRASTALVSAVRDGADGDARHDMALASLWSGMALANAGLGAVHGLAGPIGGMFGAPHGAICAALLPHVMAVNIVAIARTAGRGALSRYDQVARLLTGRPAASAEDGAEWVERLVHEFDVPGLASYGLAQADISSVIEPARRASSMKGNPVALSDADLVEIVTRAL